MKGAIFVTLGLAVAGVAVVCGAVIWGDLDEASTADSAALTLQTVLVVALGLLLCAVGEGLRRWDDATGSPHTGEAWPRPTAGPPRA